MYFILNILLFIRFYIFGYIPNHFTVSVNHLWKVSTDDKDVQYDHNYNEIDKDNNENISESKKHLSLEAVNSLVENQQEYPEEKWELNCPLGQKIQGSSSDLLQQSSTVAEQIPIRFSDGETRLIPSCYYEFAYRRRDPQTGRIYEGFLESNADKIFESTHVLRNRNWW